MKRFKNGDRVVGKIGLPYIGGKVGTVIKPATPLHYDYGVQFDDLIENGHYLGDLDKLHEKGHCRWVTDGELDPAPYFADVRVGDCVYDMGYGEGIVDTDMGSSFIACFKGSCRYTYDKEGVLHCLLPQRANQTLFYSKPVFELPPPPRRMVKKVVEGWVNLCSNSQMVALWDSERTADLYANKKRLGPAHFIRHEYEEAE